MKNILLTLLVFGSFGAFADEELFNEDSIIRIYVCDFDGLNVKVIWDENYENAVSSDLFPGLLRRGIISYETYNQSVQETFFITNGEEDSDVLMGFYIVGFLVQELNTIVIKTWGDREGTLTINAGNIGTTISKKGNCTFI